MDTLGDKKLQKSCKKYYCEHCDYSTSRKSSYDKHLTTSVHVRNATGDKKETKSCKKMQESCTTFTCENCGKEYKHRQGLWKHKKTCEENHNTNNTPNKDEIYGLIKYLITENNEIKTLMVEQQTKMLEQQNIVLEIVKNGTMNHSNNTTHTNSHNKTFNLNFFLNETCKNAMNIEEFVDQIVLNLHDLEETARLGFAEGVSKMIMKRLNALDITERPIHCSDLKRETLYIKNENKWEKEEDSKPKLTKAVKQIAGKNIKQIFEWQKVHPDYSDPDTKTNDKYMKMLTHVMSGGTIEETNTNYEKVVRNITKETIIDKEQFAV
jgi:hypothetical protein